MYQFTFEASQFSGRPCVCANQPLQHNLQHAIERVERPGGSHEGVGRKKALFISNFSVQRLHGFRQVVYRTV